MRAGVAAILLVLLAIGVVGWWANITYFAPAQRAEERIAIQRDTLLELRTRQAAATEMLKQVSAPVVDLALIADLAPGGASAAAVRFQEETQKAIAAAGGLALSSQLVSGDLGGGYTKISLLLRARFDESEMLTFLRDRESSSPIILVDSLEVHSLPLPGDARPLDLTATLVRFHADVASP